MLLGRIDDCGYLCVFLCHVLGGGFTAVSSGIEFKS